MSLPERMIAFDDWVMLFMQIADVESNAARYVISALPVEIAASAVASLLTEVAGSKAAVGRTIPVLLNGKAGEKARRHLEGA